MKKNKNRFNQNKIIIILFFLLLLGLFFFLKSTYLPNETVKNASESVDNATKIENKKIESKEIVLEKNFLSIDKKVEKFIYLVFDTANQVNHLENEELIREIMSEELIQKFDLLNQDREQEYLFSIKEVNIFKGKEDQYVVEYTGKSIEEKDTVNLDVVFYMMIDTDGKVVRDYRILNTF